MDSLFDAWKNKIPKYSVRFSDLFSSLAHKGAASGQTVTSLGKHFDVQYELYIYAFFLGLYNKVRLPFEDDEKRKDFSREIMYWGSKSKINRKDFTYIQDYIFMAVVSKSNLSLVALDKDEMDVMDAVKELINVLEEYTNGGLTIIKEKVEDELSPFLTSDSFLQLLLNVNK